MTTFDSLLDRSLLGYTKLGASARSIDVTEAFPEVAGNRILVTGATGGIGRATALRLAANEAVVHAVGRSQDKLDALEADADGTVITHCVDLSDMEATARLAEHIRDIGEPLHGIVNNVGVMTHERVVTPEGFELSYAVNLLGQYVLTANLLPTLRSASSSRIVFISSGGMYSQPLTVDNIQSSEGTYNGTNAYAMTKRGQVALANHWARVLADDGIRVNSMHPGWVDTDGVRSSLPTFRRIVRPLLRDEQQGADSIVWLVASREAETMTGEFVHDRKPRPTHRITRTRTASVSEETFIAMLQSDAKPYTQDPHGPVTEVEDATNR